ncbi:hypothetical protein D3C76_1535970 [compost metagenome]
MNNPLPICTEKIATINVTVSASAAGRTSKPITRARPPKNSAPPDSSAISRPGARPRLSMNCAVPARPPPPNRPKSFCAPWAMKMIPTRIRMMLRPQLARLATTALRMLLFMSVP